MSMVPHVLMPVQHLGDNMYLVDDHLWNYSPEFIEAVVVPQLSTSFWINTNYLTANPAELDMHIRLHQEDALKAAQADRIAEQIRHEKYAAAMVALRDSMR